MNRCKNCKHFSRNDEDYQSKKYGMCNSDKFIYETSGSLKDTEIADKLLYMDYEWYHAEVEVGEDFGCVHFSKKEE